MHTPNYKREIGTRMLNNLSEDAKTMGRWYITTVIGVKTGHLALGIGTASATTLTLIPEQFIDNNNYNKHKNKNKNKIENNNHNNNDNSNENDIQHIDKNNDNEIKEDENQNDITNHQNTLKKKHKIQINDIVNINNNSNNTDNTENQTQNTLQLKTIIDFVDACILKRWMIGKQYGNVILTEALVDLLDKNDLKTYFNDDVHYGMCVYNFVLFFSFFVSNKCVYFFCCLCFFCIYMCVCMCVCVFQVFVSLVTRTDKVRDVCKFVCKKKN